MECENHMESPGLDMNIQLKFASPLSHGDALFHKMRTYCECLKFSHSTHRKHSTSIRIKIVMCLTRLGFYGLLCIWHIVCETPNE